MLNETERAITKSLGIAESDYSAHARAKREGRGDEVVKEDEELHRHMATVAHAINAAESEKEPRARHEHLTRAKAALDRACSISEARARHSAGHGVKFLT